MGGLVTRTASVVEAALGDFEDLALAGLHDTINQAVLIRDAAGTRS